MMVIHRRNHAALARDWRGTTSVRALALASCRKNACVSSDHLPPTSQARTTSFARPKRPVNSGYVRSFLLLAMARAAPSSLSQRARGNQSRLTGDASVVSIANWPPVEQRKSLSNHFKPATILPPLRHRSKSRTKMLVPTPAPASRHTLAAADSQRVSPTTQHPSLSTSCTVVAKDVKETATGSCVRREEGEARDDGGARREIERVKPRQSTRWEACKRDPGHWAALRPPSLVLATFRSEPPPPGKTVDFGTDPSPRPKTIDLPPPQG